MAFSLFEELKQRLGDVSDDPSPEGADDIDEIETEDAYPADFAALISSIKSTFGADSFTRPPKENDEVLCVFFDPEAYHEHSEELNLEAMQKWCYDKGFAVVSRMQDQDCVKVYFTVNRLIDEEGEDEEKGSEFSKEKWLKGEVKKDNN